MCPALTNVAIAKVCMRPLPSYSASQVRQSSNLDGPSMPCPRRCSRYFAWYASITKIDADAVLAAGWDETALYHAVAVTMNRLVEGAGIELR